MLSGIVDGIAEDGYFWYSYFIWLQKYWLWNDSKGDRG